jgi:signal transduction histidine kinase
LTRAAPLALPGSLDRHRATQNPITPLHPPATSHRPIWYYRRPPLKSILDDLGLEPALELLQSTSHAKAAVHLEVDVIDLRSESNSLGRNRSRRQM